LERPETKPGAHLHIRGAQMPDHHSPAPRPGQAIHSSAPIRIGRRRVEFAWYASDPTSLEHSLLFCVGIRQG
jgi:hypothetical protein